MFERDPVAIFKIKIGDETRHLKYEILVKDSPISANNFIFLAEKGYFDGTIIYDTQSDWVRFGGYMESKDSDDNLTFKHKTQDDDFMRKISDNFDPDRYKTSYSSLLQYKLKKDNTSISYENLRYALCSNISGSSQASSEFQINMTPSPSTTIHNDSGSSRSFTLQMFGQVHNEDKETIATLNEIYSLQQSDKYIFNYFKPPVSPTTVKIESVKVFNYDQEWRQTKYKFGFESYMTDELNAFTSTTWNSSYIKN